MMAAEEFEEDVVRLDPTEISEDAIAMAFTAQFRDRMRFCHSHGKWFEWDGVCWVRDDTGRAFQYLRELARTMAQGKKQTCKANVAKGAEAFARVDRAHAVNGEIWDESPWLLGTPGGIVNLQTGELRPPEQSAYITRLTAATPTGRKPETWLAFLHEATRGDDGLIGFLKRMCGYLLTGQTTEHALFFIYGPGGNGKSVFLDTLTHILADYSETAPIDTFTASRGSKHPTDLAMLRGARGVFASETEAGSEWAEAKIKQITGGDKVTARFMRQDFFTYQPQFKLIIVGNHAPSLKNVDEALRRRFNIIPFINRPASPDRGLVERLKAEAGDILSWMIEGCLEWQADGLGRPAVIREATDDYFAEQDVFGQWLRFECEIGNWEEKSSDLFHSYSDYCKRMGDAPGSIRGFSLEMKKRGYRRIDRRDGNYFQSIRVIPKVVDHWSD